MLAQKNVHSRDQNISFAEKNHKYTILTDLVPYTSVTTWVHRQFAPFDSDKVIEKMMSAKSWPKSPYFGKTAEEIKTQWSANGAEVSSAGINLHRDIETFMNFPVDPANHETLFDYYQEHSELIENTSIEWNYFLDFVRATFSLVPLRTEWTIYNEDIKISGSIDMVYKNPDGTIMIYDWKRCKDIGPNGWNKFAITDNLDHIPDSNFWHYALQLNLYKYILETKYDQTVTKLCLVKLHPNNKSKTFEVIPLPQLGEIKRIMENDINIKEEPEVNGD
jgi:hypothetical protein